MAVVASGSESVISDDVVRVRNSNEPSHGVRTLRLIEKWRVGGEDDDILMGVITDVLAGPDSSVWLLDRQLCQVLVYSAEGEYLRTLSREGDGPGEIRMPRKMLWMTDGSLGILDRSSGQITRVDDEGLPKPSFHVKADDGVAAGNVQLDNADYRGGTLVLCGTSWRNEGSEFIQVNFLAIYDEDGSARHPLMEVPSGFDFSTRSFDETHAYFVGQDGWAIDDDGLVYYAPERDRYEIHMPDATGELVRIITRDYKQRRRTAEDKESMAGGYSMSINNEDVELRTKLLDFDPVINQLRIDHQSHLWVSHSRSQRDLPDDVLRTFDIFDGEGHFCEVLKIAGEADMDQDRLLPLSDGRFVLLRNFSDAIRSMFAAYDDDDEESDPQDSHPLEVVVLEAVVE
jgi:hypothetical protein